MFQELISERESGTCLWVFETEAYLDWLQSNESSLLWVHGNSSCGKTMLLTTTVERLETEALDGGSFVAYFYCTKFGKDDLSRSARVKQDLVYRLYNQFKDESQLALANAIFSKCQQQGIQSGSRADKNVQAKESSEIQRTGSLDLDEAFVALAQLLGRPIYLVIDALEGCEDFDELRATLQTWTATNRATIKLDVAPRPSADLTSLVNPLHAIDVEANNKHDIALKTAAELSRIPGRLPNETTLARNAIVAKAKSQFTYISLAVNLLWRP
jgi:hypothetical protein